MVTAVEEMVSATRVVRHNCPSCKKPSDVHVPDYRAHLKAVELAIQEG